MRAWHACLSPPQPPRARAHRSAHIVELQVRSGEGKRARNQRLHHAVAIPGQLWDEVSKLVSLAGRVARGRAPPRQRGARECQRDGQQSPQRDDGKDSGSGQGSSELCGAGRSGEACVRAVRERERASFDGRLAHAAAPGAPAGARSPLARYAMAPVLRYANTQSSGALNTKTVRAVVAPRPLPPPSWMNSATADPSDHGSQRVQHHCGRQGRAAPRRCLHIHRPQHQQRQRQHQHQ